MPMRALTICQPYAHLIVVAGQKLVENREWSTPYRGPLVIHAGKSLSSMRGEKPTPDMAFGAAIGMVDMVDCLHIDAIEAGEHDAQYPWLESHSRRRHLVPHLPERAQVPAPDSVEGRARLLDVSGRSPIAEFRHAVTTGWCVSFRASAFAVRLLVGHISRL